MTATAAGALLHREAKDLLDGLPPGRTASWRLLVVVCGTCRLLSALVAYLAFAPAVIVIFHRTMRKISGTAALILVLIPLCFTGRALLTGKAYAPFDLAYGSEPLSDLAGDHEITGVHNPWLSDLTKQVIPWRSALREALQSGEYPLWNRFILCGTILAGSMQAAPLDPLQLASFLVREDEGIAFLASATFFLAGLFTFLFLRDLGCREYAALLGAAVYSLNGVLAFFVAWPLGRAWAFLPLILLATRLLIAEPTLRKSLLLAGALAVLIFAGHPETVLHIVTVGVAYGVYEVARVYRGGVPGRAVGRSLLFAVFGGGMALSLTAISLLPFAAVAPHTQQHRLRSEYFAKKELWTAPGVVPHRLASSLFAFSGGEPWRRSEAHPVEPNVVRVGSVALLLAITGVFLSTRPERWFFAGMTLICGWIGLKAWPLAHLLHRLPLFDIAINDRLVFAAAFGLAVLAAFSLDGWLREGARSVSVASASLAAAALLWLASHWLVPAGTTVVWTLLAIVPMFLLAFTARVQTTGRSRFAACLVLLLFQRVSEDGRIYPVLPAHTFRPDVPLLERIERDAAPFRVIGLGSSLLPNTAALYGLEDARGYEAMTFLPLVETYGLWCVDQPVSFNRIDDKTKPFLSALNIRFAIASLSEEPDEQWRLVTEEGGTRLFENRKVLPRAFVPAQIVYAANTRSAVDQLHRISDFSQTSVITAPEYEDHSIANGPGWLIIRRPSAGRYEVEAKMESDGWLILSEAAWPGWRAYVDDRRVEVRAANHAFIGVFVPAGEHLVRLQYRPEEFVRGATISLIALVTFLVLWIVSVRRRPTGPQLEQ